MAYSAPTGDFQTTSLSGVLAAAGTSATIGTGLTLPATNGVLQISYDTANALGATDGPETIGYAAYNSGTGAITGLTRGLAGTTDVQHSNGQSVQCAPSSLYWGNNQIAANMLATTAITLGYAQITSDFNTTTVGSDVDITGLSKTVTVPAGGRYIKVTVFTSDLYSDAAANTDLYLRIKEGASILATGRRQSFKTNDVTGMTVMYVVAATAGSHTYKVAMQQSAAGTLHIAAQEKAFILVEAI